MATFGTITTPVPTTSAPVVAVNYFVTIDQLSAHNTASAYQEVAQPEPAPLVSGLSPLLPYAPFVLFALLFVVAFGLLVVNRAKNLKNMTTALVLALITASIPTVITYVGQGSRQEAKAGPDEIPHEMHVRPDTASFAVITWRTDAKHTGVVRFGASPLSPQTARVYVANDRAEVAQHEIRIGGLKKGRTYEFEILSGTTWYDNAGTPIRFTY